MKKRYEKKHFHDHFVHEEKIKSITDIRIIRKYYEYASYLFVFSFLAGLPFLLSGYDFNSSTPFLALSFFIPALLFVLYFFSTIIETENKYRIFKNRFLCFTLYFIYLLFGIVMIVAGIFTTKIDGTPLVGIFVEARFLLLGFIPLYIAYEVFAHFSFLKCLCGYGYKPKAIALRRPNPPSNALEVMGFIFNYLFTSDSDPSKFLYIRN